MATPKHPDQYPAELAQAVYAALRNGELFIAQDTRGQALNLRRYLYTWGKAVRTHAREAQPGLAANLNQVEFVIKVRDGHPGVLIRALAANPMAQAIRASLAALPPAPVPDPGRPEPEPDQAKEEQAYDSETEASVARLFAALGGGAGSPPVED